MAAKVLGIDLGTTNTCAAVLRTTGVTVIPNSEGQRTTPSVVAFLPDGQRVVGQLAKRQALTNPQNTIYSIKRFMGQRFCEVLPELSLVPFPVVSASNGDAHVQIGPRAFSPPEISAILLQKIRRDAEEFLGDTITKAVITVPAYFNDSQRNATRDAGRIAGLDVLQIINEPTASALAYGMETRSQGRIAVFDFGGGTFDISVLEVRNGVYEVKATNGDTHLGGDDIDVEIVCWLINTFREDTGIDLGRDPVALQRLKEAAERAKCDLSSAPSTQIALPFIGADAAGPKHLKAELTQSQLERMAQSIIDRTEAPCIQALEDAELDPLELDAVLVVGGASRMPAVSRLVRRIFRRDPVKGVNPDEAIAVGAAIQGAILSGEIEDMRLRDVTPLTLGIETEGGIFTPMIRRNATIPVRKAEVFSTAFDNQANVRIKVFQGERELALNNRLLGNFNLEGIRRAPRASPRIEVAFDIDANGILHVAARDLDTRREQTVRIEAASGLSEEEVLRMRQEAQQYEDEDRRRHERIALRNQADQVLHIFEHALEQYGSEMKPVDRKVLEGTAHFLRAQLESGTTPDVQKALDEVGMVLESFRDEIEGRVARHKNPEPAAFPPHATLGPSRRAAETQRL